MTMKKYILSLMALLAMTFTALTLTSCGDDGDGGTSGNGSGGNGGGSNPSALVGTWSAPYSSYTETLTLNSDGSGLWQEINSSGSTRASGTFTWSLSGSTFYMNWISGDIEGAPSSATISNVSSSSFTATTNSPSRTYTFTKVSGGSDTGGDTPSSGTGTFQGAKRVFGNNLVKKFTYTSSGYTETWNYTYDSKGFITRVDYADYNSASYATTDYSAGSTIVFQSIDKANGSVIRRIVATIGSNGYISTYSYTDSKGRENKIDYTYNSDEQITNIVAYRNGVKSWGYNFEYSDGDLVKAYELGWENDVLTHNVLYATIYYETSSQSKINNVGGIMEFDHLMHIDCDISDQFAFGAFGKPNKHLPLYVVYGSSTFTNTYTLDGAGRVTAATNIRTDSNGSTSTKTFTWEW